MAQVMAMPGTEEKASPTWAGARGRPARCHDGETTPFQFWLQGLAGCGREEAVGARGRHDGLLRGSRGECDTGGPERLSASWIARPGGATGGDDADAGMVVEMGHGVTAPLARALAAPRGPHMTAVGGSGPAISKWTADHGSAGAPGASGRGAGDPHPLPGLPGSPVEECGPARTVMAGFAMTVAPAGAEREGGAAEAVKEGEASTAELTAGEIPAASEGGRATPPGTPRATLPAENGAAKPTAPERAAAGVPREEAALEPETAGARPAEATANATGCRAAEEGRARITAEGGVERAHARYGIAAGRERAERPSASDEVVGVQGQPEAGKDPGFHARLSGTAARETSTGRAEARMLEVRDRIIVAAARTVSRGETVRAQLKLVPESLGKLDLEVEWNGGVTVRLTAHSGAAFEAMQRGLPQLRAALLAAGLDLEGLHLGMEGGGARGETAARRGSAGARRTVTGAEAAVSAVRPSHDGILDIEA